MSKGARSVSVSGFRRFTMFWVNNLQQAIGSLGEMMRTPIASLMTIAVLGLSLTLPASLYVVAKNSQDAAAGFDTAAEISLFLRKDLDTAEIERFRERVGLMDEVADVTLLDKESALKEFRETSGFGSAIDYLESNPLPDVLVIIPADTHRNADRANDLLNRLESEREVSSGTLDSRWIERLQALGSLASNVFGALGLLLCLAVVLIVGNTIRLAILNRKEEIMIMKLVGATDGFIQRPFLYTGFWYGVIGGVIAWICTSLLIWWVGRSVTNVAMLYDGQFGLRGLNFNEMMVLWGIAIVLGLAGSWIAVRRHVASIEPR